MHQQNKHILITLLATNALLNLTTEISEPGNYIAKKSQDLDNYQIQSPTSILKTNDNSYSFISFEDLFIYFLSIKDQTEEECEQLLNYFNEVSKNKSFISQLVERLIKIKDSNSIYNFLKCFLFTDFQYETDSVGKALVYSLNSNSSPLQFLAVQVVESYNGEKMMGRDYELIKAKIKSNFVKTYYSSFTL